jgi:nucleotidyltransferase/DNA polymerase involved in DNA repair
VANPTLTDVEGIGPAGAAKLRRHGLRTVRALADASLGTIEAVPGFGRATAGRAQRSARSLVGPTPESVAPAAAATKRDEAEADKSGKAKKDKGKGKGKGKKKGKGKGKKKKKKSKKKGKG